MRVLAVVLSFLLMMILISCGGDDGTAPDPPQGPEPVAEGTIGIGGGELVADDVVLTVAPGTLAGDTELKIFDESDTAPLGQEGHPVYSIEGLPEDLGLPVALRIRHGVTTRDGPALFIGQPGYARSAGYDHYWDLAACRDSSGWCLVEITQGPHDFGDKIDAAMKAAIAEGLVSTQPSAHFVVRYLESNFDATRAAWTLEAMEEAYDNAVTLGFNFGAQDTIWPRPVIMVAPEGSVACWVNGPHAMGHFRFTPHDPQPSNIVRSVFQHEVLHLAQMWFDARLPEQWIGPHEARTWLDEATATWSEKHFYEHNYPPISIGLGYMGPLAGVAGHPTLIDRDYGYGMTSFIKTMVDNQGAGAVHDLFVQFALLHENCVAALQAVLDPPLPQWCLSFQQDLVGMRIYDLLGLDLFNSLFPLMFLELDIGETCTGSASVRDFGSAGWFVDLLDQIEGEESNTLRIDVSEGLIISAYKADGIEPPVLIDSARGHLTVNGMDTIDENYGNLIVLATKDWSDVPGWDEQLDVDVELRMVPAGSVEAYTRVDSLSATVDITWSDETGGTHHLVIVPDALTEGEWTDDEFLVEWTNVDGDMHYWGAMALYVDSDTMDLTSFAMERNYYQAIPGGISRYYEVIGDALPLVSTADGTLTWRAEGFAACATLTTVSEMEMQNYAVTLQSTGYSCRQFGDGLSFVEIRLSDPSAKAD